MLITNSQYLPCDLQVTYMYTFHRTYRSLGHNSYTRPTGRMLITNIQYLPCDLQVTYMYAFHRTYRSLGISRIQDLQVVCVSHDEPYKLDARGGCAPARANEGLVAPTAQAIEGKVTTNRPVGPIYYGYIYQHTRKKTCCWTIFTLIFLSRFPREEEKLYRFLEKKSKIILAVNFFSADEIFRNRKKIFWKSAVLLKIDLFSLFWNFLEISFFRPQHFQKCVLIDISSPRKL